jgi:hypothetical protein
VYGEWKRGWPQRDRGAELRKKEEERGWLASNTWLTIITHPLPVFLKVFIPKGFKFFRKNTSKSVDSR